MDKKPVLHYFTIRGRGDSIRFVLDHLGIEWEEKEIPSGFLPEFVEAFKAVRDDFEFRKCPVLEIDGHKLCETRSIIRYLMLKANRHPTDPMTAWRVDSLADHHGDIEMEFVSNFFKGKEAIMKFVEDKLIFTFGRLQKRLEENTDQKFFVGDSVTIADALWQNFYHTFTPPEVKEIMKEKFPVLYAYFENGPKLFPWIDKRPPSKF